ncbi:hypothetical protein RCZ04_15230 [Capnocytophaga sp. HP1101]
MQDYFEIIETGSPKGARKPEAIEEVIKQLGVNRDEVLYIGDTPSDIVSCREAGVKIASVAWAKTAEPETLKALHPYLFFSSVDEFSQWCLRGD